MTNVLAIAEHRRGELRDVSLELVTAGRELTANHGGVLHVGVIGDEAETLAPELDRVGVDVIHTATTSDEFNHDVYTQVVSQLYDDIEPQVLLLPHSVNGLDYAPAVAETLDLPLLTDAIHLEVDDGFVVIREQYGGKVETEFDIEVDQAAITIRPTEWERSQPADSARVETFDPDIDADHIRSTVVGYETASAGDVDISDAEFIIAIGRGIQEGENLSLIEELVDVTGATLASSRPIVDSGWLPKTRQVGQSGKVVTPDVYIAIGISGAVQHVAGMKSSGTIIAINTDAAAPIFDIADYGVVGDLFDIVPELINEFGDDAS